MKRTLLCALLTMLAAVLLQWQSADAQVAQKNAAPLLMRNPTVNSTDIVFSYAGALWIVSRQGGEARRLTSGAGNEANPIFSPDGQTVAFTGDYDGNVDVYTVPAAGGVPKRLTFHPGSDNVAAWTPDGKRLLFVSGRDSDSGRFARLFTMTVDGTFPEQVPLPMGFEGSFSPNGSRKVFAMPAGSRSNFRPIRSRRPASARPPALTATSPISAWWKCSMATRSTGSC